MRNLKAGMLFICITVTLDMIGVGLVTPSLPEIMRRFLSNESDVSQYFGYFISVYALMQFLASPLLGALSDRFGRRPLLLVSLLMAGFDYVLMAYAPNLEILFIGRILAGLTGASISVAMAYIADISQDHNRATNFGMVGAAFGIGFIIGPAIGGLIGQHGPHYPFLFAAVMNIFNFVFGYFILPESLPKNLRRNFSFKRANPFSSLRSLLRSKNLVALFVVFFLLQLAGLTHPSIWTLYTEYRYGWSITEVGLSLALVGLLSALSQGGLTRIVIPRLGERKTILWGAIAYAVSFIAFGLANQGWMIIPICIVSAVSWVAGPALQSLLTNSTPSSEQGELQGTLVSLGSLAAILSPLITTKLFSSFTQSPEQLHIPGMPYFFAALVCFIAWLVLLRSEKA